MLIYKGSANVGMLVNPETEWVFLLHSFNPNQPEGMKGTWIFILTFLVSSGSVIYRCC